MLKALSLVAVAAVALSGCASLSAPATADAVQACQTKQDPRLKAICVAEEKARSEASAG